MKSMTYGTIPAFEEFDAAFDRECPEGYSISLGRSDSEACEGFRLGNGRWQSQELYDACREIVGAWRNADSDQTEEWGRIDSGAVPLVSGIMGTLGFEWI